MDTPDLILHSSSMVDQSSQSGSFYSETNGIGLEKRELFISENEAITKPPKNSNDQLS